MWGCFLGLCFVRILAWGKEVSGELVEVVARVRGERLWKKEGFVSLQGEFFEPLHVWYVFSAGTKNVPNLPKSLSWPFVEL